MSKQDAPPPYSPAPNYGFAVPPDQQQQYPPQQGAYPAQPGYPPQPQYGVPPPSYGTQQPQYAVQSTPILIPGNPTTTTSTVVIQTGPGNCPVCGVGVLREELTCFGITMAILFFPLGLLCLLITQKRCSQCGSTF